MMAMIGSPLAMPKTWGGQMLETRPAPDFNPVISCVAGNAGLDDGNSNGGASSGGSSGRGEHKEVPGEWSPSDRRPRPSGAPRREIPTGRAAYVVPIWSQRLQAENVPHCSWPLTALNSPVTAVQSLLI